MPARYCDLDLPCPGDEPEDKRVRLWTPVNRRDEEADPLEGESLEVYLKKSEFGKLYTNRAREWVRASLSV